MGKLYYFQAPNFDINPNSPSAPKLGSIFFNLDRLTGPLNQDDLIAVPQRLVNQSSTADFRDATNRSFQTDIGLNATAAQGIAGSADLVYGYSREREHSYNCELLETIEFTPDDAFVSESITVSNKVQRFLEHSLFGRKRVYMITGLKIASGFSRSSLKATQHNPSLTVGVSGAALGIPAEVGPGLGVAVGDGRTVSHGPTLNKIVFAYRVIRIKVRWDGEARYKYMDGGKYGLGDDSDEDEEGKWVSENLEEEDRLKDFPESIKVEIEPFSV